MQEASCAGIAVDRALMFTVHKEHATERNDIRQGEGAVTHYGSGARLHRPGASKKAYVIFIISMCLAIPEAER